MMLARPMPALWRVPPGLARRCARTLSCQSTSKPLNKPAVKSRPIGRKEEPATLDRFMDLPRFFEALALRCQSGHAHTPRKELVGAFGIIHVAAAGALLFGPAPGMHEALLFGTSYTLRLFGVTAGHHRYFSHRSFKTSRWFQCVLATLGASAFQRGPLWWASHHLEHHKHSDTEKDSHSPVSGSLVWAHLGWFWASEEYNAHPDKYLEGQMRGVSRWAQYPELVWIDNNDKIPPIVLLSALFALDGTTGLLWGFVLPTVAIWHAMFSLNSACHTWGDRRFPTADQSRNVPWLTLPLLGENWHNNHHAFHWSARAGLKWWEIDPVYYGLKGLEKLGVVWALKVPSEKQLAKLEARAARDPTYVIKNTSVA